jgi:hypothetical protein
VRFLIGAGAHVLAVKYFSDLEFKLTNSENCHKFKVEITFKADVIKSIPRFAYRSMRDGGISFSP